MSHLLFGSQARRTSHRRNRPSRRRTTGLAALGVVLAAAAAAPDVFAQGARADLAIVLELEGHIDGLTAFTMEAQLKRALERQPRFVILAIESPGGDLVVAKDIAYNFASHLPQGIRSVAWIKGEALSAATLVAFGCDEIAMSERGSLGDMLPFKWHTLENRAEWEAKLIPPWRAELVSLAEKRGYPVDAASKMVDPSQELLRVDAPDPTTHRPRAEFLFRTSFEKKFQGKTETAKTELICEPGRTLVIKQEQALAMGICKYTASSTDELVEKIKQEHSLEKLQVERVTGLWWEQVVRFLTATPVRIALFVIGMIAFVIALLHPGLGAPEATAVIAFGLCFFGGHLIGLATAIELILFVIGAALVAAEILMGLPTHGVLAVVGGVIVFASLLLSLQKFVIPSTPEEWGVFRANVIGTCAAFGGTAAGIGLAIRLLPKTRFAKRLIHTDAQAPDDGGLQAMPGEVALTGTRGVATTMLRPVGKVDVDGQLVDAIAESGLIEKGTAVVIVGRRGPEVIVAPTGDAGAAPAPAAGGAA